MLINFLYKRMSQSTRLKKKSFASDWTQKASASFQTKVLTTVWKTSRYQRQLNRHLYHAGLELKCRSMQKKAGHILLCILSLGNSFPHQMFTTPPVLSSAMNYRYCSDKTIKKMKEQPGYFNTYVWNLKEGKMYLETKPWLQ